jgi:hypothetical protein
LLVVEFKLLLQDLFRDCSFSKFLEVENQRLPPLHDLVLRNRFARRLSAFIGVFFALTRLTDRESAGRHSCAVEILSEECGNVTHDFLIIIHLSASK